MPEEIAQEQAPAEEQVTPEETAPPEGDAEQSVDYEKRYNDLRSEHDRRVTEWKDKEEELQLLTSIRSDPQTQRQLLEELQALGLEEEDDEGEQESYQDPRVDQLSQQLQELQQDRQVQEIDGYIQDTLGSLTGEEDITLTPRQERMIVTDAIQNFDPNADGLPDIHAAFAEWKEDDVERRTAYSKSKRAPKAPSGQSQSKQPDLSTSAAKAEYMNRRLQDPGLD